MQSLELDMSPGPHPNENRAPEPIKDLSQKCTEVPALAAPKAIPALVVLEVGPDPDLRVFEVWVRIQKPLNY